MVAELLCISAREEELVHVHKLGRREAAVGTVLLEALVPLLDCVLVVARVRAQELQVLLAEALFAFDASHGGSGGKRRRRRWRKFTRRGGRSEKKRSPGCFCAISK